MDLTWIDPILAIDWVELGKNVVVSLIAVMTALDIVIKSTPTKWDDEHIGPFIGKAMGLLSRFSLKRNSK